MHTKKQQRDYEKRLDAMIETIFKESDRLDLSLADMARRSGLHYNTVCNLNSYATRLPRLRTVLKLAWAVGLDVQLVQSIMGQKVA